MSTVSPSTIRQRVSTAIINALQASGWQESGDTYDTFGEGDGDRIDKSYAVGVPSSRALGDRQVLAAGALAETTVAVKFCISIPAMDQVAGYDAGLDAEALVLAAVLTARQSTGCDILVVDSKRDVAEGWFNDELVFRAIHRWPLQ